MFQMAVIFDLDDTLYAEQDYVLSGFRAVDSLVRNRYSKTGFYDEAVSLFESGERKQLFNRVLERLNIRYNEGYIQEMVHHYRNHKPDISLLEDAEWALLHLKGTVKLGLISDGFYASQELKIHALKISEHFHSIILSDRFGREHWKPSSVPYNEASRQLQFSNEQCVYVGDNANKDFITAKKLGWTTVHIDRKEGIYTGSAVEHDYEAHYKIDSLTKLTEIPVLTGCFR